MFSFFFRIKYEITVREFVKVSEYLQNTKYISFQINSIIDMTITGKQTSDCKNINLYEAIYKFTYTKISRKQKSA